METCVIETDSLTKVYGKQVCVDNLNIHVPAGKIYGLLGRNGAGKTTTMKMLLNLAAPTSGSIFLFGENAAKMKRKVYYRIGSMIETPGFYENLTAEENLKILARLRGQHRKDTIEHALSLVSLDGAEVKRKVFKTFSLGMKQRLGIAAALMHEPELLILDEPINGLDPIGIHEIRNYLLRLCREKGTTILLSSHILNEIEQLADVIGVMHDGKLVEEADMEELRKWKRRHVAFEVSDVNAAALVLEREYRIDDYVQEGRNLLKVFERIDDRDKMNRSFIEQGIFVAGIHVCEEKLENHFTKLIGGGNIG